MRVVSGSARGRRLSAPLPTNVRPTTDRVKESIFDILGSLGGVQGLEVVDLYCGSGALGIEALSRGAASVTFVDADKAALDAARTNLAAVGLGDAPATFVLTRLPGWTFGHVDVVLADPPYDASETNEVLEEIDADTIVLESRDAPRIPHGWVSHRQRTYGSTLVTVMIAVEPEAPTS
jgi:16S rRNA (guanine966-N2)-methyltransferase